MKKFFRPIAAAGLVAAAMLGVSSQKAGATPPGWQRISVSAEAPGFSYGVPQPVSMDRNGDTIAFVWYANLNVPHVYVWEKATNAVRRIAVPPGGDAIDSGGESAAVISHNGRYVIFSTRATNFVPNDTNGMDDVFATDLQTGAVWPVSVGNDGRLMGIFSTQGSPEIGISDDGRYAVFVAYTSATGQADVFIRDSLAGTTTRISGDLTTPTIPSSNQWASHATISPDGNYVVFATYRRGLWLWERSTGVLEQVNVPNPDAPPTDLADSDLGYDGPIYSITPGGRYVAFSSRWKRLTADDGSASSHARVYVRDRLTGQTELISKSVDGQAGDFYSGLSKITISDDGRLVGFDSSAGNLTDFPRYGFTQQYFLKDRQTGEVRLLSRSGNSRPAAVRSGAMSDDGSVVALGAYPWDDLEGNGGSQVYRTPIAPNPPSDGLSPQVTGAADRPAVNSWYNAPVTVLWTATDPAPSSGVPTQPSPTTLSLEGAGQTAVSGPSCDPANNCANGSYGPVNIDLTGPVITVLGNAGTYTTDDEVAIACDATDGLSGVATVSCPTLNDSASAFGLGVKTFTATATDLAGNQTTELISFTVSDVAPPVLTVPSNRVVDAINPAGVAVSFVVSAVDAYEGAVPVTCTQASGSVFAIGVTAVSCTASDSSGNQSLPSAFTVTVRGASAQLNDLAVFVTGVGPGSSLSAKVAKVQDDLAKGKSACADLQKVIAEAIKNPGGQATTAQVSAVVASAQQIMTVLGC